MRPLAHLGVGPNSIDYQLYQENEELYDNLSDRGERLIKDAYDEFMGDHAIPPLATRDEMNKEYERRLQQRARLMELEAPQAVLDSEDEVIVKLYTAIQHKKYASPTDPVYKKYRDTYEQRRAEWEESDIFKNLLDEIRQFNEAEYNKFKQEFAPR